MIALSGILLGKAILLLLILYYCCKSSPPSSNPTSATTNTTPAMSAKEAMDDAVKADIPPSYSFLVMTDDPPPYLESVINAEINPEINRGWAEDLESNRVDPEVSKVVEKSRADSLIPHSIQ